MNREEPTYAQRLIQAQARAVTDRCTEQAERVLFVGWDKARPGAVKAAAEVLTCLLEDAAFYGEDAVSVRRIKRLRDQLNPAAVDRFPVGDQT